MISDAEQLVDDWDSIREGYFPGEPDETLSRCVERLGRARAAVPRDPDVTAFFTLGLVLMSGHATWAADSAVADRTADALLAVASDPAAADLSCGHGSHPCDDGDLDMRLELFPALLSLLGGGAEYTWDDLDEQGEDPDPESRWRCPRTVVGFARSAAEAIRGTTCP
ncbi:hypothetical protein ABVG11_36165 [Streptomyces sp. HD1123-B1]|uniref:hypothetical protein n=1 Tax=Streptomyces huangiella TaxID=3228804 RepID=UPI003D7E4FAA